MILKSYKNRLAFPTDEILIGRMDFSLIEGFKRLYKRNIRR